MNWEEKRNKLIGRCEQVINSRIEVAQQEMSSYTAQSKEETKSSAGDKYETGRAMIHLEKEKIATQLNESIKLRKVVGQLRHKNPETGLGRLIITDQAHFFISISLGLVTIEGESEKYFMISPVAPLAKLLLDCKESDKVSFNGKTYQVKKIIS